MRKQPFREIWTGEKAQRFRAKLAKEPLPICARCCGNFVYGKWERPGIASPRAKRASVSTRDGVLRQADGCRPSQNR